MFFGLDMEKVILIGLLAVLIVGPERLPRYAEALGRFVRNAREWFTTARERVKTEMGDDFDDIEWRRLDPRQYDPRRIIREALLEEPSALPVRGAITPPTTGVTAGARAATEGHEGSSSVPFDAEAT